MTFLPSGFSHTWCIKACDGNRQLPLVPQLAWSKAVSARGFLPCSRPQSVGFPPKGTMASLRVLREFGAMTDPPWPGSQESHFADQKIVTRLYLAMYCIKFQTDNEPQSVIIGLSCERRQETCRRRRQSLDLRYSVSSQVTKV